MKKFIALIVILLGVGIGFTKFFPLKDDIMTPKTSLIRQSLQQPIRFSQLQPSSVAFDVPTKQKLKKQYYALQVGLFGSLVNAENNSQSLLKKQLISDPLSINVLKVSDKKREWYIVAVSYFTRSEQADKYAQLLQEQGIKSQLILWPY